LVTAVSTTAKNAEDDDEELTFPAESCGAAFTPTKQITRAATKNDNFGYEGDEGLPAFLTGVLPSTTMAAGALLFVKRLAGWAGIAGEQGHFFVKVYAAPDRKQAILFSMWGIEGPGHEYTIMATRDAFDTVLCSTLEFPAEVKSPENFMDFIDFNVDESGQGALIGTADLTSEDGSTSQTHWYRYSTADGGKTWTAPEILKEKPEELSGIYFSVGQAGFCDLRSDLLSALH
jgi:hypothetical protein